ncbi:dihydrofolate reductase family protein [Amycolatopsis jejuensis]|uniref:dihydrofolate reductase family protein n=1 Tax=Amycolatopsis jejuensis TaxID=330084 RepID=UPI0005262CBE|nr:dihydrofolate reductase family protein [Amycolatopsis jejuensis]
MRRLILKMSMSLDGFVSGPHGEGEWTLRSRGEDSAAWVLDTLRQAGVHVMGSRMYRTVASYWSTSADPMAAPMNEIPKVVFTRQTSFEPETADGWASARIASGDLADEIQRLKAEPGNDILAHGGVEFARSLVQLGLVDEYRLAVHPIALGSGRPLFADLPQPLDLELVSTTSFEAGVVAQVYRPG